MNWAANTLEWMRAHRIVGASTLPGLGALLRARGWAFPAVLVALLASGAAAAEIVQSSDVVASGKLSIANTVDYAPFGYLDADGRPTGIVVDLANEMARLVDAELDLQRTPFPAMMPGLAAGRFKIAWESFSITPERLEKVSFVVFLQGGLAASVLPDRLGEFIGNWPLCGKHVGVSAGTASDFLVDRLNAECAKASQPDIEKSMFNTSQDIVQAVLSGRLDVRLDDATASSYFEAVNQRRLAVLPNHYDVAPMGLAIAKHDHATAAMVISTLSAMFESGVYQSALEKYGMGNHAVAEPYLVEEMEDLRNE